MDVTLRRWPCAVYMAKALLGSWLIPPSQRPWSPAPDRASSPTRMLTHAYAHSIKAPKASHNPA